MIGRIIAASARHRVIVLATVAALAVVAWHCLRASRLDALPDLSDTQVLVAVHWERSPDILEDQVTYPVVTGLLGVPRVRAIRGLSDFGSAFVTVIFEDRTDLDWARARVVERLSEIRPRLPAGATVGLGPDATGVGWVFQYALVDRAGRRAPDELRAFQDWTLRYALQSVPGVAEVATVGGFVRQIEVTIDPARLRARGLSRADLAAALARTSGETGAGIIESGGAESMVRGRGSARSVEDFERAVVGMAGSTPVLVRDVARVGVGQELRRGVADLDGEGEVVGGIVIMRHGENALEVIRRVKERLRELRPSLPEGVDLVTTYDRSALVEEALRGLRRELLIQMAIVSLVILAFLWHLPSAIVPILTLPAAVLLSFIPLFLLGVTINIMSLAGIAISIGVLVDGAIVEMENAYNRLSLWQAGGRQGDYGAVRLQAMQEVGPAVFYSLLIIAVAFLPIFALEGQEGRLFRPLAASKTLAMLLAAGLAITLDPALRMLFARMEPFAFRPRWLAGLCTRALVGTYRAEDANPINRAAVRLYLPACRLALRRPWAVIGGAIALVAISLPVYGRLGSEFMPELEEGTILYMPVTVPGVSVPQARQILAAQDRALRAFPEVERVFGKAGRADTVTDPAPVSMFETTVMLRPPAAWRRRPRWYSAWAPAWLQGTLRRVWPDRITVRQLIDEMDRAVRLPGVANAWTMPIRGRTDMLSTGMRTPIGIKILGTDLQEIDRVGERLEAVVRTVPGARSAFAERNAGGSYLDVVPRRDVLARYGVTVGDLQDVLAAAVGGEPVTTVVEGRVRTRVVLRDPRNDQEGLARLPVATPAGPQVPLGRLADIRVVRGPAMVRDENGFLAGYVYVDVAGRDLGSFVAEAREAVRRQVKLPTGTLLAWSGQFESMQRVRARLTLIVPLTLALIFLLLMLSTRSAFKSALVMLAVPFSIIGVLWLFYLLGYHVSVAAWVGAIALLGLDAETAVFMLLFLDLSYARVRAAGGPASLAALDEAIVHGAVRRVRPKLMTVAATLAGLLPIMLSHSAGADVTRRIAAPMLGGIVTSFLLELLVYPPVYKLWKLRTDLRHLRGSAPRPA